MYHGSTPTGRRIHLGEHLIVEYASGKRRVQTRCGTDMFAFEAGQAPPARVSEYCKTCYRSVAWDYFVQAMEGKARLGHG